MCAACTSLAVGRSPGRSTHVEHHLRTAATAARVVRRRRELHAIRAAPAEADEAQQLHGRSQRARTELSTARAGCEAGLGGIERAHNQLQQPPYTPVAQPCTEPQQAAQVRRCELAVKPGGAARRDRAVRHARQLRSKSGSAHWLAAGRCESRPRNNPDHWRHDLNAPRCCAGIGPTIHLTTGAPFTGSRSRCRWTACRRRTCRRCSRRLTGTRTASCRARRQCPSSSAPACPTSSCAG